MFDQMRRNTKTILWITVIAFVGLIFLAWGADFQFGSTASTMAPGSIGLVNGQAVPGRLYDQMVIQGRENYKAQAGREPDERTDASLRSQAWTELVQDLLLRQEVQKRGITVSDAELREVIMNQPPPEVMSNPQLQTNGQFDLAKYQALLRNPNVDTRAIEMQYRMELPVQKLRLLVAGSVGVSELELWNNFEMQNEKIRVNYLMLPGSAFPVDDASLTEDDLRRHYEGHKSSYRAPVQAVLQYVMVNRRHTDTDSLNLIEQGRSVLQELREGETFEILVDAYSEAPANMRGGEAASWFTADRIAEPAVREAAFSMAPGQVSDVLPGAAGVHIIQVLERRETTAGPEVRLADVFLPLRPSPETISTLRESVAEFRNEINRTPFETAASELGLAARETPPFGEGGFIPGIGSSPELVSFAFAAKPGETSVPLENADGWIVARLKERREPRVPDLADIRERVRAEAADSMRVAQAAAAAEGLLRQAQGGTPLSSLASADSRFTFGTTEPFHRLGFPAGIGNDPGVIGPLFAGSIGVYPQVLRGRNAAFVCEVLEKIPADRAIFDGQKDNLRRSLLQRRQNTVYNEWLAELKRNAEIKDFRFGAFDL